jgi:hypothetical protein
MQPPDAESPPGREHRVYWWKEALVAALFYAVYSWTRNQFGSNEIAADGFPDQPFTNAERIIDLELSMGMFHEQTVQAWFLPYTGFIQFWNVFYGTAHFAVTLGVFVLLFVKRADVFPLWRNALAAMTALAILGFAFFPLMPPRLLDAPCPIPTTGDEIQTEYGGACIESSLRGADGTFGFVDTLAEYGGPWSFDSETMASISNQYAAMPSLHIGWATWCALAVWPLLRRRWAKGLVLLYPTLTLFTIGVTGNHYWIDGVGGLIVFGLGALIGFGLHRWNQRRLDRKYAAALAADTSIDPPTEMPATETPVTQTTGVSETYAVSATDASMIGEPGASKSSTSDSDRGASSTADSDPQTSSR